METDHEQRRLFDEAVDLPPAERAVFLSQHCSDPQLRTGVESLLDAHERAGSFLAGATVTPERLPESAVAESVGPYKIVRLLGEGGYGTVYLVDEGPPLNRLLALKVIKPGMDSRQVIARFELERQALAIMDHPNIARVLNAGTTEAERPFFVLEFVDGIPITRFCRENRLTIDERLRLFTEVCSGVQHAHQKGIIHLDLKPGNVLVATPSGRPLAKIIDFGIAKALDSDDGERRAFTTSIQILGTPQFMSPEQACIGAADVDTRSDIYSLGVLLYELLTDLPPLDSDQLRRATFEEILRVVREVDPLPPSQRNKSLVHRLRGDLDWIVMHAMEKDRNHRYATVEAFSADIARHLNHEPVVAGPPSRKYRLQKFARRNRVLLSAAAAVTVALLAGLGLAISGYREATRQRDNAEIARAAEAHHRGVAERQRQFAENSADEAKREAASVRFAQAFLYHLFLNASDGTERPPSRQILDFIAHRADEVDMSAHPEVEAPLRAALGDAYFALNLYDEAIANYKASLELNRRLAKGEDLNIASTLGNLGSALMCDGRRQEASPFVHDSLAMYRRILGKDSIVDAPGIENVGMLTAYDGDLASAIPLLRQALDIYRGYYGDEHPSVVRVRDRLVQFLKAEGKTAEAEAIQNQATGPASAKQIDH